jgi:hypothetical protein
MGATHARPRVWRERNQNPGTGYLPAFTFTWQCKSQYRDPGPHRRGHRQWAISDRSTSVAMEPQRAAASAQPVRNSTPLLQTATESHSPPVQFPQSSISGQGRGIGLDRRPSLWRGLVPSVAWDGTQRAVKERRKSSYSHCSSPSRKVGTWQSWCERRAMR